MSGKLTDNYVLVKSQKTLRKQLEKSRIRLNKAGSNDIDNTPGQVKANGPLRNSTGVAQPQSYQGYVDFGETLTTKIGGMGVGSTYGPPQEPLSAHSSYIAPLYPNYSENWRRRVLLQDHPFNTYFNIPVTAGSVINQTFSTKSPGSIYKELERTVSIDGDRIQRARGRHRKILRKEGYK